MALKTCRADCNIGVTTLTKLTLAIDWSILARSVSGGVTVDAFRETEFTGSITIYYRLVPAMFHIVHVITADIIGFRYTRR